MGVAVTYGIGGAEPVTAVESIDLDLPGGSFVSLVGPSGCGKSTLLKVVADLMAPTRGRVTIAGAAPQELRRLGRIGLVFQQANLMPWLRVIDNVRLLRALVEGRRGVARCGTDRARRVGRLRAQIPASAVRRDAAACRARPRAGARSGGAFDDEPFAALDEITRDRMGFELMRIWHRHRKTVLFVTHSLAEAVFLSDRVVLMSARPGRVHRVFEVDLPRPRDRQTRLTDRFHDLVAQVNRELYKVMA